MSHRRAITNLSEVPGCKALESDIRGAIKEFLEIHGYWVWINWQGPMSYKGVTDLTAISRSGEVWWVEVKTATGQLRSDQIAFRDRVVERGGNWLLARSVEDVEHLAKR